MNKKVVSLVEIETRAHRSAFDTLLPEDCKVFAYFEDDGKFDELMLMILKETV